MNNPIVKPGDKIRYRTWRTEHRGGSEEIEILTGTGIVLDYDFESDFFYAETTSGDFVFTEQDSIDDNFGPLCNHVLLCDNFEDVWELIE